MLSKPKYILEDKYTRRLIDTSTEDALPLSNESIQIIVNIVTGLVIGCIVAALLFLPLPLFK